MAPNWPSDLPHGDNTDTDYELQHNEVAAGRAHLTAGPHTRNNPPAAHVEGDSHHREKTLGGYHPLLENAAWLIERLRGEPQTAVRPPNETATGEDPYPNIPRIRRSSERDRLPGWRT